MGGSSFGPSELSASAQDTSADSNVFNTQGPSADHGLISFNFHLNHENFSNPLGKTPKGALNQQMEELTKQNDLLKKIISQIAPSIIPVGTRRKRSIRPGPRPRKPWRKCFRPSPLCPPRPFGITTTTSSPPIYRPPLPILRAEQESAGRIAGRLAKHYLARFRKEKANPLPEAFQMALSKYYGIKPIAHYLGLKPKTKHVEGK